MPARTSSKSSRKWVPWLLVTPSRAPRASVSALDADDFPVDPCDEPSDKSPEQSKESNNKGGESGDYFLTCEDFKNRLIHSPTFSACLPLGIPPGVIMPTHSSSDSPPIFTWEMIW